MPDAPSLPENHQSTSASCRRGIIAVVYGISLPILGWIAFGLLPFPDLGFLLGLAAAAFWGSVFIATCRFGWVATGCSVLSGIAAITLVISVAWMIVFPPPHAIWEIAVTRMCKPNMHNIMLALHNYHDAHGSFPPPVMTDAEGRAMHSWRALIMIYIDEAPLYEQYDMSQPWDSPANLALKDDLPFVYKCLPNFTRDRALQGLTSYFLVTGDRAASLPNQGRTLAEFSDGTDNTIMLIESNHRKVPWTQPTDFTLDEAIKELAKTPSPGETEHRHSSDFFNYPPHRNVAMVDGTVKSIADGASRDACSSLLTIDDGGPDLQALRLTPNELRTPNLARWAAAIAFVVLGFMPLFGMRKRPATEDRQSFSEA